MATKTTARTSAFILATFALVGLLTTGVVAVQPAFAQTADGNGDDRLTSEDLLGDLLSGDNGDSGTNEETETDATNQSGDQSEINAQSNNIDQDQTGGISNEIGSGEGSSVASDTDSEAESTYKTKYKSRDGSGSSIPGTSTSDSISTSDVSNNGTVGQNEELNNAAQVNSNEFGGDESRAATVGFDFEFEQSVEEEQHLPLVENGGTDGGILDALL